MPLLDQIREKKLIDLAKACFDPPPTAAEEKVLRDSASSLDPDMPAASSPRPTIRSEFVRWLATDPEAATHIDPKGLRAFGIILPDKLDLRNCRVLVPLHFQHCTFKSEIDLRSAETRSIGLLDSLFDEIIRADRINVDGPLFLRGSIFSGEIRLPGAQIKGALDCLGAKLKVAKGNALTADRAEIGGFVYLQQGFESSGTIRLPGAKIKGDLSCSGAKLRVTEVDALFADGAKIGGSVFLNIFLNKDSKLREDFEATGTIRLPNARIGGVLSCSGARMKVIKGDALFADFAEIGGNVLLSEGFESSGSIRLLGAQIRGSLNCTDAKLTVPPAPPSAADGPSAKDPTSPVALSADGAKIRGEVRLSGDFASSGEVRLLGAKIKGQLNCNRAKLTAKGHALTADGAKIGSGVFLNDGFESSGEVRLLCAKIGGQLICDGAKLRVKDGYAISAPGAEIDDGVFFTGDLESSGEISLYGARIGGQLAFLGGTVAKVNCTNLRLSGDLFWTGIRKTDSTVLDLTGAKVKNLRGDRESWPNQGNLILDGLVYDGLTPHARPTGQQILKGYPCRTAAQCGH